MSQENVELVREALDAFNAFMRGELTGEELAHHPHFDPQIEAHWHEGQTMPDIRQHLQGGPAFIRAWEQVQSAFPGLVMEPLEFVELPGDRVLTPIRQSGRGRESGIPIEIHFFEIWTIRGKKIHKCELFRHRADALEAAGLRE